MPDFTLTCQDCSNEFIFTEDDQIYYYAKDIAYPKYCLICRAKHRAAERDPGHRAKMK